MLKKNSGALVCAMLLCASAQAAGVNKIVRATIDETQLQGYTAAPPPGWTQQISYTLATAANDPAQNAAALVTETASNASTPPRPSGITMISLANGAILSKENLPGPLQILAADCNIPNGLTPRCPSFMFMSVLPDVALPSRLIVQAFREAYSAGAIGIRTVTYVFDPGAIPGGGSRWTQIQNGFSGLTSNNIVFSPGGKPAQNLYAFTRIAPTTTRVEQIVNK